MFHLRFTPYDISGYTFDFLGVYDRYIIAYEDKDKYGDPTPPHYHVYIETDYGVSSIRNDARTALKIPVGQRGKANKWFALISDWKDPSYMCKYNDIRGTKGFSEKEIVDLVIQGKKTYLKSRLHVCSEMPAPVKRISIDKQVIADCITFYELAKKKGDVPSAEELITEACRAVRSYGKGINPFKIREYVLATWFEVGDRELVVKKCLALL